MYNTTKTNKMEDYEELTVKVLKGFPASGGKVEGTCTVIKEKVDLLSITENSIIATETASVDLIPFMPYIKGLITRKGGALSVLSWHARRYGVPAVFGIEDLMDSISDGDYIRIDGEKGEVEIIK